MQHNDSWTVSAEDPGGDDGARLMDELSETLAQITGASGRASFDPDDVRGERGLFVVARDATGAAVGCGALRPLTDEIAEVKRMFARPGTFRVGTAILEHLEAEAVRLGYTTLWLETRRVNERAVAFYNRRGYEIIPNYGKYAGNEQAVCFGKRLLAGPQERAKS